MLGMFNHNLKTWKKQTNQPGACDSHWLRDSRDDINIMNTMSRNSGRKICNP